MSIQSIKSVNFATSGLTTVGYQLLNPDKTVKQARTTEGVSEIGATGIYCCLMTFDDAWTGIILWDTGEAEPTYAIEDFNYQQYSAGGGFGGIIVDWAWTREEKDKLLKQVENIAKALKVSTEKGQQDIAEAFGKLDLEINVLKESLKAIGDKKPESVGPEIATIKENIAKIHNGLIILAKGICAAIENQEIENLTKEVENVLSEIVG